MKELLIILVSSAIVNNVVLSQFLGLCPFLGVSKSVETAAGMGGAIIFVITLSSFVTGIIYNAILVPTNLTYLQTIVFILLIAALVQLYQHIGIAVAQQSQFIIYLDSSQRSEERRVGKECRSRWSPYH